jgi:hypothetical protein
MEDSSMAKILYVNVPAHGHVNPTLPVVAELAAHGHQVVYYNSASFEQIISATGARFRPYPNSDRSEIEFAGRVNNLVNVTRYLLEESLYLTPFLLDEIAREKPDVIVFDSIALWGMAVARLKKIPSIASITTLINDGVSGILNWRDYLYIIRKGLSALPALQRLRRRLVKTHGPDIFPGKAILPCRGDANMVFTSRLFQPQTAYIDESFYFVGSSILEATRKKMDFPWERLDPERPIIYLSLGTLYNNNPNFYRMVYAAFLDHPAQFILSLGGENRIMDTGAVPNNFIVQPNVPQLEVLQKAALFVTHGGMNSVNESLYYGVPLVVVPQQIEQAINGRQVARHGAGIVLADSPPYGKLSADLLRQSVAKVLADPLYRQNADKIRKSFREAGGYQRAASLIASKLP